MQNLIYLVIMALAGGAGWWAGSWKGRDAVEAVARYQKLGEDAQAELAKAKGQLASDLAAKDAKFDAELPSSTPNGRFGCFPTADPIGINNLAASR